MPKAHGSPTKEFFIKNIIKDISLEDCILDLLDNCLDGANKAIDKKFKADPKAIDPASRYRGYEASITLSKTEFVIDDNCAGISVKDAINYAFHFGRRADAPKEEMEHPIGLYGIGMKRAMFKIGQTIKVESSTETEAFTVNFDVPGWLAQGPDDWDFPLEEKGPLPKPGTKIEIKDFNRGIADEFDDPVFINRLIKSIGINYSLFLQKSFKVTVKSKIGTSEVVAHEFSLKESDKFVPINFNYTDETGVNVDIKAGLAGFTPEDPTAELKRREVEYDGWYVICNDRVVLAANKNERTVWGDEEAGVEFPMWHQQYGGFLGITSFTSTDPNLLPWTTTKREIELSDPLYRRAVTRMKEATRKFINYTNAKKADLQEAKEYEREATPKSIYLLQKNETMKLPFVSVKPGNEMVTISYQKKKSQVLKCAESLGNRNMHNKQVGIKTFDYYWRNEIEE